MAVTLQERLNAYERLMRLDKPIGILLLLWPALWGLWLAGTAFPTRDLLLIFVVGVLLMRSAGCIVNDLRRPRLRSPCRAHAQPAARRGADQPHRSARGRGCVLLIAAFALVLQLNRLTVMLSFVALAIMVIYPFLKRVFRLSAGVAGHRVRLLDPDGLCGAVRQARARWRGC